MVPVEHSESKRERERGFRYLNAGKEFVSDERWEGPNLLQNWTMEGRCSGGRGLQGLNDEVEKRGDEYEFRRSTRLSESPSDSAPPNFENAPPPPPRFLLLTARSSRLIYSRA